MEASSICYNSFIELWLTHPGSRSVKCRGRWFLAHSELCIHRDCQAPWRRRHPERHPQLRASPPARARLCSRLSAVLSGRFQQAERTRVALCTRCSRRARRFEAGPHGGGQRRGLWVSPSAGRGPSCGCGFPGLGRAFVSPPAPCQLVGVSRGGRTGAPVRQARRVSTGRLSADHVSVLAVLQCPPGVPPFQVK